MKKDEHWYFLLEVLYHQNYFMTKKDFYIEGREI